MALRQEIDTRLKEAMKEKAADRVRALRQIKSELLKLETSGREFSERDETAMLKRLVKQHRESIEAFEKAGRTEQAAAERAELEVIRSFLPAEITGAELEALVREAIGETGAASPKEMGRVMKHVMARGLPVDGKAVSELARKLLSGA